MASLRCERRTHGGTSCGDLGRFLPVDVPKVVRLPVVMDCPAAASDGTIEPDPVARVAARSVLFQR